MAIIKNSLVRLIIIQVFLIMSLAGNSIAGFIGPFTVTEGKFGKGPNEFGIYHDDMGDSVPTIRSINSRGNIFLVDEQQVKIFNSEGLLLHRIKPKNIKKADGWPAFMDADSQNNIYTSNYDKKLQKYSCNGDLIWERNIFVSSIGVLHDNNIIICSRHPEKKGKILSYRYSSKGQILKTNLGKPLELGIISHDRKIADKNMHESIIKYPDHEYKIYTIYSIEKHYRDELKNLFSIERFIEETTNNKYTHCYRVYKHNFCNNAEIVISV